MSHDCLFCRMIHGSIPTQKAYENEQVFAFHDIDPKAPIHILIIPKQHIATVNDATPENAAVFGELILAAKTLAKQLDLDERGYRLLMNCNAEGGQSVYHIHLHLLGGRQMQWPPG